MPNTIRLIRAYRSFNAVCLAVSSSALFMMHLNDQQDGASPRSTKASVCLFTSTVMTGVVAALITTIISFHLEGCETLRETDRAVAWLPALLVGLVSFKFLIGLVTWYNVHFGCSDAGCRPAGMMSCQLGGMGLLLIFVAVHLGRSTHRAGPENQNRKGGEALVDQRAQHRKEGIRVRSHPDLHYSARAK